MLIFQKKKNVVGLVFKDTITKKLMWSINCIFFYRAASFLSLSLSHTRALSISLTLTHFPSSFPSFLPFLPYFFLTCKILLPVSRPSSSFPSFPFFPSHPSFVRSFSISFSVQKFQMGSGVSVLM